MSNPSEVATLVEAEIYHLYVKRVYGYIYHRVGNVHEAEDLTAQVFMAAWEVLPRYQEKGIFGAWLFGIARNKVANFYRQRRPELHLERADQRAGDCCDPLTHLEQNEHLKQLSSLIEEFGQEEQELLRLRFAADLSYREIGAILGKSEAALKMKVKRLLRNL